MPFAARAPDLAAGDPTRNATEFRFPVFVRARDSGDVHTFASAVEMRGEFEKIDVENNEYEAWDADGRRLLLSVTAPDRGWLCIDATETEPSTAELADAIPQFAQARNVPVNSLGLSRRELSSVLQEYGSRSKKAERPRVPYDGSSGDSEG